MKAVILLVALCVALAVAAPLRPVVSETFEAKINVEFVNGTYHAFGIGDEARDYAGNRAVFRSEFDHPRFWIYELARFDTGVGYELDSLNYTTCHNHSLTGHLPSNWAWLANATYVGQSSFRNQLFDWWNSSTIVSGITFQFAAAFFDSGNTAPSVPAYAVLEWTYNNLFEKRTIGYDAFFPQINNPNIFDVPSVCAKPTA